MFNLQKIERKWLSHSIIINIIYYVIWVCYGDRTSPFTIGITPVIKNIYETMEMHGDSKAHRVARCRIKDENITWCIDVEQNRQVLIDIDIFMGVLAI